MNLNLNIAGQDVSLCQTPTTASYAIFVEGDNLQTAKNYVQWVRDSFSAEQLQEMDKELENDYHAMMAVAWDMWEEGDPEPSVDMVEYRMHNHPVDQAQKIVTLVEDAMEKNYPIEFSVW